MNKKILACLIAVIAVVVIIFIAVNNNSKSSDKENDTTITTSADNQNDTTDSTTDENTSSSAEKPAANNAENNSTDQNAATGTENDPNVDIDAVAKADIAKTQDDAVKKLLDFYLGEGDAYLENTIKVTLTTNADNTVTVAKTDGDSNIYFSSISAFVEDADEGLIITIDSYNEADKTYSYTLKNYTEVKAGHTDNVLDSGKIPEEGNVISEKTKK